MRRLAIAIVAAAAVAVSASLAGGGGAARDSARVPAAAAQATGQVVLVDKAWTCTAAVSLDLVKVTMSPGLGNAPAVIIGKGCTGDVARVEVDTWDADAIKVQNAAPVAHDLTIGGGYVKCWDKAPTLHQDGVQAMGGTSITFDGLAIDCGRPDATLVDSDFFVNKSGSGDSTPTGIVCDHCYLGPGPAAHEANIGDSVSSGLRASTLCPDKTPFNGALDETGGGVDVVDEGNTQPTNC